MPPFRLDYRQRSRERNGARTVGTGAAGLDYGASPVPDLCAANHAWARACGQRSS